MYFKNIKFYNVPYDRDDHHLPLKSVLPDTLTPIYELNKNCIASLKTFWSVISLPIYYFDIMNANYIMMEWNYRLDNDENINLIYGWIDKIEIDKDSTNGANCKVYWTVDYWRTYFNDLTYDNALVINRSKSVQESDDPIQFIPVNYELCTDFEENLGKRIDENKCLYHKNICWVLISYLKVEGNETKIINGCFPVNINVRASSIYINNTQPNAPLNTRIRMPSFQDIISGKLLTDLKIQENHLIGCYLSPLSPVKILSYELENNNIIITIEWINGESDRGNIKFEKDFITHYPSDEEPFFTLPDKSFFDARPYSGLNDRTEEIKNTINIWWNQPITITSNFLKYIGPSVVQTPILNALKWSNRQLYNNIKSMVFIENSVYYYKLDNHATINYVSAQNREIIIHEVPNNAPIIKKLVHKHIDTDDWQFHLDDGTIIDGGIGDAWVGTNVVSIEFQYYNSSTYITDYKVKNDCYIIQNVDGIWPIVPQELTTSYKSDDYEDVVLMSYDGTPIKKFPKQVTINKEYTIETIVTNTNAYLLFRFGDYHDFLNEVEVTLPITALDVGQTYLNEYLISGQRTLDQSQRSDAILKSIIGGVIGIGGSLLTAGALSPALAVAGFNVAAANSIEAIFGEREQTRKDNYNKNKGALIRSGSDYSWILNGYPVSIVKISKDGYSIENYNDKIKEYGIKVSEIYNANELKYLLSKEGPVRMAQVQVIGDAPIEAKHSIRDKLLRGVYLDENL